MNTLKELLDIAIQAEIDAQKLYRRGAQIAEDKETQQFLEQLVMEEVRHENMLFNIRETGMYDLDVEIPNEEIFEMARTSHETGQVNFEPDWDVEKILEVALKREFNAQKRYAAAAESVKDDELITLFRNLAEEEGNHHRKVERQYNLLKGKMGKEL
ncbi:MAG TPA: hypothetical protein ENJ89_04460 [Caldithrix abyssi]|uniref:Rubrerythrin diiron-binding domain-containing protein n=1 Tax=Caldithrix abyssi TaxID=187145 RepID=A0A7V5PNM9_CALAY|nr:hypothetical protein [Caldithrix abyssi]